MTKRLTLVGLAVVAVLWGPYVYAELARQPADTVEEPQPVAVEQVVVPTPVAYKPSPSPDPAAEPGHTSVGTSIDPDRLPEPAVDLPAEPAVAEPELGEPPVDPNAVPPPSAAAAAEPQLAAAQAPATDLQPSAAPAPAPAAPAPAPAAPAPAEAPAADPEVKPAEAPAAAAPAEPAQENAEKTAEKPAEKPAAADVGVHAKALRESNVNVIPDTIAPAFRSAFDRETRDVAWAGKEERGLSSFLSGAGVPSNALTEVRCQSTVCRVSINVSLMESGATQIYQRVQQEFGQGVALDPSSKDQGASFFIMRRAR